MVKSQGYNHVITWLFDGVELSIVWTRISNVPWKSEWVSETDMSSIKVLFLLGYDIEYTGDNIPISSMKESIIE